MGRVALVTGGTRGIGKAITARLAADGYRVCAGYAGTDEAAKACAAANMPPRPDIECRGTVVPDSGRSVVRFFGCCCSAVLDSLAYSESRRSRPSLFLLS